MGAIDADALKSALWESWGYNSLVAEICEFVDKQPTIQPDEPRVMTWEEVAVDSPDVVWLEYNDDIRPFEKALPMGGEGHNQYFLSYLMAITVCNDYEYGKTWRCWSHKPTDEQRKAVKWDG